MTGDDEMDSERFDDLTRALSGLPARREAILLLAGAVGAVATAGELDPATRLRLYQVAERLLLTDAPSVLKFHPAALMLVASGVEDYIPTSSDVFCQGQTGSLLTLEL
jgi:hypothetical protein